MVAVVVMMLKGCVVLVGVRVVVALVRVLWLVWEVSWTAYCVRYAGV